MALRALMVVGAPDGEINGAYFIFSACQHYPLISSELFGESNLMMNMSVLNVWCSDVKSVEGTDQSR